MYLKAFHWSLSIDSTHFGWVSVYQWENIVTYDMWHYMRNIYNQFERIIYTKIISKDSNLNFEAKEPASSVGAMFSADNCSGSRDN